MQPLPMEGVLLRLAAVVGLGALAGVMGAWLLHRMLEKLRQEGTLGLL